MTAVGRALVVTCLIEVPLVALLFPGERLRMAVSALVVNAVTNLALNLWILPSANPRQHAAALLAGEVGALLVEAMTYALVSRRHDRARALIASGLGNAASYAAGGLLAAVLAAHGG